MIKYKVYRLHEVCRVLQFINDAYIYYSNVDINCNRVGCVIVGELVDDMIS